MKTYRVKIAGDSDEVRTKTKYTCGHINDRTWLLCGKTAVIGDPVHMGQQKMRVAYACAEHAPLVNKHDLFHTEEEPW